MRKCETELLKHLTKLVKDCTPENQPSEAVLEAIKALVDGGLQNKVTRLEQRLINIEMALKEQGSMESIGDDIEEWYKQPPIL